MDLEYVKQNGYAAWQVIPLFFVAYIGMLLVFAGSGQLAWYIEDYNIQQEHTLWKESWTVLIAGICVLSVSILYSIIVCLLVFHKFKETGEGNSPACNTTIFASSDNGIPSGVVVLSP